MLQLDIYHSGKKTYINAVLENGNTLVEFDHEKGLIDLSVLCGREGTEMIVRHYNVTEDNQVVFDYGMDKVLGKVDKDENGMWFVQY